MSDTPRDPRREEPALSRRDWFRLRRRRQELLGSHEQSPLQPTEQPPNHDGMDLSELPPMHEAVLSDSQLASLFSDIEQCASAVRLVARRRQSGTADGRATLQIAARHFMDGALSKLQIRYQWQGARWIDTLERRPTGTRLVRIRHTENPPAAAR